MIIELLPDHVDVIEAHLRRLGWIGPNELLEGLAPAGAGNMNRTLRARLTDRSLVLKQSVPYVAKYPHIPAPVDRIAVEAAFYRATAQSSALAMRLPRVLGFDPVNRLLALEDLGEAADFTDIYPHDDPRNYPHNHPHKSGRDTPCSDITAGHMSALLDWIGALHGLRMDPRSWPELENRAMRELNHAHIFDIPLRPDNALDLERTTPGLDATARRYCGDTALRARVSMLGAMYLGSEPHASTPSLLHGDYYPGSWLRHPRLGVAIIDPEFAFIGPPEFDIGVLIAHCTFASVAQPQLTSAFRDYDAPEGFSFPLAFAFAGVEVIRRLLGVAQLPLVADLGTKEAWLAQARRFVIAL